MRAILSFAAIFCADSAKWAKLPSFLPDFLVSSALCCSDSVTIFPFSRFLCILTVSLSTLNASFAGSALVKHRDSLLTPFCIQSGDAADGPKLRQIGGLGVAHKVAPKVALVLKMEQINSYFPVIWTLVVWQRGTTLYPGTLRFNGQHSKMSP